MTLYPHRLFCSCPNLTLQDGEVTIQTHTYSTYMYLRLVGYDNDKNIVQIDRMIKSKSHVKEVGVMNDINGNDELIIVFDRYQ